MVCLLMNYALALFDFSGLMREANKLVLTDTLWEYVKTDKTGPIENVMYDLDGVSPLQKIPCTTGKTYNELCQTFV